MPKSKSSKTPTPAPRSAKASRDGTDRQDLIATLVEAAEELSQAVDALQFGPPVTHVYNPLGYASLMHRQYLEKYAFPTCEVIFVGMNPGPWGMAQTGIPFGEIPAVRDWLDLKAEIDKPANEHPKRPVIGLDCDRSEVSGQRLWGLFQDRYPKPELFFHKHFVANYCPLVFMESTGKNRTPDKLPTAERIPLEAACDAHLRRLIDALNPKWVIGVGKFAEDKAKRIAPEKIQIGTILHPSPASPMANRGWGKLAEAQLVALGIWADR